MPKKAPTGLYLHDLERKRRVLLHEQQERRVLLYQLQDRWVAVDWAKRDSEIAGILGVSRERVRQKRLELGKPKIVRAVKAKPSETSPEKKRRRTDWETVNWALSNAVLASLLDQYPSVIANRRKEFAPDHLKKSPNVGRKPTGRKKGEPQPDRSTRLQRKLAPQVEKAAAIFTEYPGVAFSASDIAEELDISPFVARTVIHFLRVRGQVVKSKPKRPWRYKLAE